MFRSLEVTRIFRVQSSIAQAFRVLSTQPQTESKFQDEWNNAKPFESMPALSVFQLMRNFAPGGNFK
jgi:hypothetical protein